MTEDNQENPWPGFVDIMSSALLVFVFLVLVQLLVIAGISLKIGQNLAEQVVQRQSNDRAPKAELKDEGLQGISQIEEKEQAKLIEAQASLKIIYSQLETLLSPKNIAQLNAWVKKNKNVMMKQPIQITSVLSSEDLSMTTSAFVSYNRLMDLRDRLIKQGLPASKITVRISNSHTEASNHVVIQVSK